MVNRMVNGNGESKISHWLQYSHSMVVRKFSDNSRLRIVLFILLSLCVDEVHAENTCTIPKDTKVSIVLQTGISSNSLHMTDEFTALTCEDLSIDGQVPWPQGTKIAGVVIRSNAPPLSIERSGYMRLVFNTIQTENSLAEPLSARLVRRGGVISFRRGTDDIKVDTPTELFPTTLSAKTVAKSKPPTLFGLGPQDVLKGSILLTKKGKPVDIKVGDVTKIELLEDFKVEGADDAEKRVR